MGIPERIENHLGKIREIEAKWRGEGMASKWNGFIVGIKERAVRIIEEEIGYREDEAVSGSVILKGFTCGPGVFQPVVERGEGKDKSAFVVDGKKVAGVVIEDESLVLPSGGAPVLSKLRPEQIIMCVVGWEKGIKEYVQLHPNYPASGDKPVFIPIELLHAVFFSDWKKTSLEDLQEKAKLLKRFIKQAKRLCP